MLYGANNSNNDEDKKKRDKEKKEAPLEPTVKNDNKFEGISHNDILLSYISDSRNNNDSDLVSERDYDHNYMLLKAEYESSMIVIKEFYSEIGRLTNVCKEHEKKLQGCDQEEKNLKEEIITLRTRMAK